MKKLISSFIIAILFISSVPALASEPIAEKTEYSTENSEQIEPRINWSGSAYLTANVYSNIVTSNNVFPDNPKVINDANNPGTVLIRVKSSTGEIIGNVKRVAPGQSVTLDTIPAMSGTYVIQGQAGVSGNYYFHIT